MDVVRRPPFGDSPRVGERGASTQRKILSAALGVFGTHGFHDTRVELITEAAGCSRPSFYQYFSSKEDVFWRLAADLAESMEQLAEQAYDTAPDDEGLRQLQVWLDDLIDLQADYAAVFSAFPAAVRAQTPIARKARRISERIGEGLTRNLGRDSSCISTRALASMTVTSILRTIHYWRAGLGQIPRDSFVEGLAQTIHRLQHGAIAGVNTMPLTNAPAKRAPRWPEFSGFGGREEPLRPRGRKTRQRLLDAAIAVLPERGYHDTRVDDLVEKAGVSHGSFYRYFDNKNQLFYVLAEQAAAEMVELVATFPKDVDASTLRPWLEGWFGSYSNNGGVISAWQEIDYDDPELATFSLDVALVVFDRLQRIIHSRGFGDSAIDALVLLAVIERVPFSVEVLRHVQLDDAIDASMVIIRRALFGHDAA